MGILVVIAIQILGLLISGLLLFLPKMNPYKSFMTFLVLVSTIQSFLIVLHEIKMYEPTYTIQIPENYSGCVYLFLTTLPKSNVEVDNRGIGYVGSKGQAQWEVSRGKENISEVLSTFQQSQIPIRNSSNTQLTSYDVFCLEINDTGIYPTSHFDYEIIPYMDSTEFIQLVELGMVNEGQLRKMVWNGNGSESSWELNPQKSRL